MSNSIKSESKKTNESLVASPIVEFKNLEQIYDYATIIIRSNVPIKSNELHR